MGHSSKISQEKFSAIARRTDRHKSPTADWECMVEMIAAMNEQAEQESRRHLAEVFPGGNVDVVRLRTLSSLI
jgi:hypothetical protein